MHSPHKFLIDSHLTGFTRYNRADEHLAQYAKKDYEKFLEEARETIPDGMPVEFARRQVESAKKNEPAKLHFGSREPLPMDTPFHTDVDELEQ